jgi:signal transduction histidine kinase
VEDDGIGFELGEAPDLAAFLSRRHFGLAGMHERAELIGARMVVDSKPGQGTRVLVAWNRQEGDVHSQTRSS